MLRSRVVWKEGMHLAQHHFQQQARYFEGAVHFTFSRLFFAPYGLTGIELDADALRNGTVAISHAQGIMPDGLAFDISASDPPPAPLSLADRFSPITDTHLVLLSIPAYSMERSNVGGVATSEPATRFRTSSEPVLDDTQGRDERPVAVGRKNLALVLDGEAVPGRIVLPIARVRRDGSGHFVYDADYVPPLLYIGANRHLLEMLHRLVQMLEAKRDSMTMGHAGAVSEFARREIAGFWLLHTINASIAPLRHLLESKRIHPERLYQEMARIAGGLCTFSLSGHPRDIPLYDHDDLTTVFEWLDRNIRTGIELVAPSNVVTMPLRKVEPSFHAATLTDGRALGRSRWILGVRSTMDPTALSIRVPLVIKLCARDWVREIVNRAHPGLPLQHLQVPPAGIMPRADTQYFAVTQTGGCWKTLVAEGEIAAHVPDGIPGAELELLVLLDE